MKKTLSLLALVASLSFVASLGAASAPNYDARIWAVKGFVKENPNPDNYANWASNMVQHVYDHGAPPMAEMLGFDYRLKVEDITQFLGNKTNKTVWYMVQFKAKNAGARFRASQLKFVGDSSDSNHYLTNSTSLDSDPNIVFSPPFWGITYNGAPRASDTIRSSAAGGYIKDVDLDETIFIGEQWPYFQYTTGSQWNSISNYVMGVTNFSIAGTWYLRGDGTNILTKVSKTLGMKASPIRPYVSMDATSDSSIVTVTANTEPFVSGILFSRSTIGSSWKMEGNIYSGQVPYVFDQGDQGYFKVEPQ